MKLKGHVHLSKSIDESRTITFRYSLITKPKIYNSKYNGMDCDEIFFSNF